MPLRVTSYVASCPVANKDDAPSLGRRKMRLVSIRIQKVVSSLARSFLGRRIGRRNCFGCVESSWQPIGARLDLAHGGCAR
jgi:hypothetical protein